MLSTNGGRSPFALSRVEGWTEGVANGERGERQGAWVEVNGYSSFRKPSRVQKRVPVAAAASADR